MDDPRIDNLYERARLAMSAGNLDLAIDALKELLADEPDEAQAHAWLSFCLLDKRRVHAAEVEARVATSLDPDAEVAHLAMGRVLMAARKLDEAEGHLTLLLERSPMDASYLRAFAELCEMKGDPDGRLTHLDRALESDPNDPDTLAALAACWIDRGVLLRAESYARDALEQTPEHQDALVAMGRILLRNGDVDGAREHARWALRIDPTDLGALGLITEIKAQQSRVLGLWWRYNTWINSLGDARGILVLLLSFAVYNALVILCDTGERDELARLLRTLWSVVVLYTWIGPELYERALKKELAQVELDADY